MQFDFRSIYASILKDWFRVPQSTINTMLPSRFGQFPYVPVLRPDIIASKSTAAELEVAGFSVFPNPARERATVEFECEGGHVQVLLFDAVGREVKRVVDRTLPRGQRQIPLDVSGLTPGVYHCHVREGQRISSRSIAVQ